MPGFTMSGNCLKINRKSKRVETSKEEHMTPFNVIYGMHSMECIPYFRGLRCIGKIKIEDAPRRQP
jgi:hypothetical protein